LSLQLLAAKLLKNNDICKKKSKKYHFYHKTKAENLEIRKKCCKFAQDFEKKI